MIDKAQVTIALCDAILARRARRGRGARLRAVSGASETSTPLLARIVCFGDASSPAMASRRCMKRHDAPFANVDTAADDTCLLAFTSGTTGQPKATMHFHRDVMASLRVLPAARAARERARRRLHRQPAARVHLRARRPHAVPDAHRRVDGAARKGRAARPARGNRRAARHRVLHRAHVVSRDGRRPRSEKKIGVRDGGPLRKCVAAGEALPAATRALWRGSHRHRNHRRHRRHRADAHLHLRRRSARAARRHRQAGARLPRQGGGRRRPRAAARHHRQAGGAGRHRLPLPRRRAPGTTT